MYRAYARLFSLALSGAVPFAAASPQPPLRPVQYPPTRTVDHVDTYGTTKVADPYRWLEAIDSTSVTEWVRAQNALTMPYLAALPGRDVFKQRITALYDYPRSSLPFWEGGRWFYAKNSGLQRQSVWYSRLTLTGPEQLVLDPNQLSPDGKSLAYGQSEGGSDWVTFYVRDLASRRNTADTIRWAKFSGASWTKDGKGFFYSRYPEPPSGQQLKAKLENQALYYHRLGTPQSSDVKVYARPDNPSWFVFGGVDESGRYLFVTTSKGTDKNELYMADLGNPMRPSVKATVKAVVTGQDANYFPLGVANGRLFLQVDKDTPKRKIVAAPASTPGPTAWKTVIPEGSAPIEGASLVAGRIGVLTLQDVASVVRLYTLDGKLEREVPLPGLGSASGIVGRLDRPELFFSFTSPLYPATAFLYDAQTNKSQPFNPPKLTFDPAKFETERVFYTSKDGTRVPMFITHRRSLAKDGNNPTMLYAYGGFAISETPGFRPDVIAWVEQGGVYAVANIRGGGEYGEEWHRAGQFERKQNVFDDFIAAAEYLIREKYTSSAKLAINGGSNGGSPRRRGDDAAAGALRRRGPAGRCARHAPLRRVHRRRGVGDGIRIVEGYSRVPLSPRVLAAAEREGGGVLSGRAAHDCRPRRPRGAEPLVQVRGDTAEGAERRARVREASAPSRGGAGQPWLSPARPPDRGARGHLVVRRVLPGHDGAAAEQRGAVAFDR